MWQLGLVVGELDHVTVRVLNLYAGVPAFVFPFELRDTGSAEPFSQVARVGTAGKCASEVHRAHRVRRRGITLDQREHEPVGELDANAPRFVSRLTVEPDRPQVEVTRRVGI